MARPMPKKLAELGRIRIGDQEPTAKGGKRPHKLEMFRLTSANKPLLHYASNLYGGEVRPWVDAPTGDQWELYTATNALDVLVPTASAVSVSYEQWTRGGCSLRCTGAFITHSTHPEQVGLACICPEEDMQRVALAQDGKACQRILRLNVLLPDLPGLGCWRLETKGYYATAELLGTLDMLQGAGMAHTLIEAVLRLDQRTVKREGKTLRFNTPVLWPKYTPRQLLAGSAQALLDAPAPAAALPSPAAQLQQHIADLYGERVETAPEASPVGCEITAILEAQELSHEAQSAFWARLRGKYADLTPGVLAMVRDQLRERQVGIGEPETRPSTEAEDAMQEDIPF